MKYDSLEPGPELDALVSEKIMHIDWERVATAEAKRFGERCAQEYKKALDPFWYGTGKDDLFEGLAHLIDDEPHEEVDPQNPRGYTETIDAEPCGCKVQIRWSGNMGTSILYCPIHSNSKTTLESTLRAIWSLSLCDHMGDVAEVVGHLLKLAGHDKNEEGNNIYDYFENVRTVVKDKFGIESGIYDA